jgi:hypothetical protein
VIIGIFVTLATCLVAAAAYYSHRGGASRPRNDGIRFG